MKEPGFFSFGQFVWLNSKVGDVNRISMLNECQGHSKYAIK